MPVDYISYSFASPTDPLTVFQFGAFMASIFRAIRMPLGTVRCPHVLSTWRISTFGVFSWSRIIDMDWIHALRSAAKMIGMSTNRDFVNEQPKPNSVRSARISSKEPLRIARLKPIADPKPTRDALVRNVGVDQDSTKEVDKNFQIYRNAVRIVVGHLSLRYRFTDLGYSGANRCALSSF